LNIEKRQLCVKGDLEGLLFLDKTGIREAVKAKKLEFQHRFSFREERG
jgi:hypothetical protein